MLSFHIQTMPVRVCHILGASPCKKSKGASFPGHPHFSPGESTRPEQLPKPRSVTSAPWLSLDEHCFQAHRPPPHACWARGPWRLKAVPGLTAGGPKTSPLSPPRLSTVRSEREERPFPTVKFVFTETDILMPRRPWGTAPDAGALGTEIPTSSQSGYQDSAGGQVRASVGSTHFPITSFFLHLPSLPNHSRSPEHLMDTSYQEVTNHQKFNPPREHLQP